MGREPQMNIPLGRRSGITLLHLSRDLIHIHSLEIGKHQLQLLQEENIIHQCCNLLDVARDGIHPGCKLVACQDASLQEL